MGQGKKSETYKPIYPTTVGAFSHDITFAKLPAYSMSAKPVIKTKFSNENRINENIFCNNFYQ